MPLVCCILIKISSSILQTMETQEVVPDRKLLARLVLIREEARDMMGGGILDERNDRGLSTLPESEVSIWLMADAFVICSVAFSAAPILSIIGRKTWIFIAVSILLSFVVNLNFLFSG